MAKRLYIKGNYVIADNDGVFSEYPTSRSAYTTTDSAYLIIEQIDKGTLVIPFTEIGDWLDAEVGGDPFTDATLKQFLQNNTANFNKGGATTFGELTDVPPYLGNAQKWLRINNLENGIEAVEYVDVYDSGWKPLPIFNGSYGVANTGNLAYRPQIRIVGKTLYMMGLYQLPEPTVAGGTILDTNGAGYVLQGKQFSDLYTGAGNGWEVDNKEQGFTRSPILPLALRPITTVRGGMSSQFVTKTKNITGGRMRLTTWISQFVVLADGRLVITGIEATERNGDTGTGWNKMMHLRKSIDRFNAGDKLMNYDNYRNSFDSLGLDTLRNPNVEGYSLEYDFDGSKVSNMGGFFLNVNTSFLLNPALTQDQIKTAFDAI